MRFNRHLNLAGTHALFSASNYHWINYTEEKLDAVFFASMAARRGTELHAFAHEAIRLGIKLPDTGQTINSYVNDGIGFKMTCEQILFYSLNFYGTADCVAFRRDVLRISDLKTGVIEASPHQLEVYVALFCLEYDVSPLRIKTELRIYQSDEVKLYIPDPDDIMHIMDRIRVFDKRIEAIREELQQ